MSWTLRLYRAIAVRVSLKDRIFMAAVTTLAAIALYGAYSLRSYDRMSSIVHQTLELRLRAMLSAEHTKQALYAYDDAIFRYLATGKEAALRESRTFKGAAKVEIGRLTALAQTDSVRERIGLLKKESDRYFKDADLLPRLARKDDLPQDAGMFKAAAWAREAAARRGEMALLSEESQSRLARIFGLCEELVTVNRVELELSRKEMDELLAAGHRNAVWGAGAVAVAVGLISLGLYMSLMGPIAGLLEGVRKVEKGDLSFEIPATTDDELGELSRAFNRMTATVRKQREELVAEAITDPLTGAHNRRWFDQALGREVERAKRFGRPMALVLIDVDHFKEYNDSRGHEFGDEVLRRLGPALRAALRDMDLLARYGGDEFAAVLPEASGEEAREVAGRLLAAADKIVVPGFPDIRVTLSVGGASLPEDAETAAELFSRADEALYFAKQAGRNRVSWIKEENGDPAAARSASS